MKKNFTYLALLLVFFGVTAFAVIKYNGTTAKKDSRFPLKERTGSVALLPEWATTRKSANDLHRTIEVNGGDVKSYVSLAGLYIQEARITGDYTYYDAAAMAYIDKALKLEPQNFDALLLKSLLQLSQHHFSEAIETAGTAQKINPYNAFVYGVLVDGNVEMGNYKAAVDYSDQMMSRRPDIRSYSRVAYLREIHGDLPGAIEAMTMAVDAAGYGDESSAWAKVQLGRLYEMTGDVKRAEMYYTMVLEERPGFGHALAGLGHIAMGQKDYSKAITLYQRADSSIHDYAFKEQLAEIYLLSGQKEKAEQTVDAVIKELNGMAAQGEEGINHHADKELAYVYLLKNDHEKALKHALLEYSRRPDNIDVNEAVAWAHYKKGEAAEAVPYMDKAMRTNCVNPSLLCHAGLVYAKAGQTDRAKTLLTKALEGNSFIDPALEQESRTVLQTL